MKIILLRGDPHHKVVFVQKLQAECAKRGIPLDTNMENILLSQAIEPSDIVFRLTLHQVDMLIGFAGVVTLYSTRMGTQMYANNNIILLDIVPPEYMPSALDFIANELSIKPPSYAVSSVSFFSSAYAATQSVAEAIYAKLTWK